MKVGELNGRNIMSVENVNYVEDSFVLLKKIAGGNLSEDFQGFFSRSSR